MFVIPWSVQVGSITSMFINLDMWEIYGRWSTQGIEIDQLIIGGVLMVIGFVASFLLTKYELNRNKA